MDPMDRVVHTFPEEDHQIHIVESIDEDASTYFVVVDDVVINQGEPFEDMPTEGDALHVAKRWWKGSRG